jgi:hypothetical protein
MNKRIKELAEQAREFATTRHPVSNIVLSVNSEKFEEKFAELIVQECIDKIETHRIPVGNSAAGEMACERTYAALKEIRDEIKQHFGVEL